MHLDKSLRKRQEDLFQNIVKGDKGILKKIASYNSLKNISGNLHDALKQMLEKVIDTKPKSKRVIVRKYGAVKTQKIDEVENQDK